VTINFALGYLGVLDRALVRAFVKEWLQQKIGQHGI